MNAGEGDRDDGRRDAVPVHLLERERRRPRNACPRSGDAARALERLAVEAGNRMSVHIDATAIHARARVVSARGQVNATIAIGAGGARSLRRLPAQRRARVGSIGRAVRAVPGFARRRRVAQLPVEAGERGGIRE